MSHRQGKRFDDVAEITLNSRRWLQALPKHVCQHALKSRRFVGITTCSLEDPALKEITQVTSDCFNFPTINSVPDIFFPHHYLLIILTFNATYGMTGN
jgi:hypothetical protein